MGGNKGGWRNKVYFMNGVYNSIIKKAMTKDAISKLETHFADDDEEWKLMMESQIRYLEKEFHANKKLLT